MADIRCFAKMASLADNSGNNIAPFGELSTKALTYSRLKQNYAQSTYPDVEIVVFSARNDSSVEVQLDAQTALLLEQISQWVHDQYIANAIPRNTSKAAFVAALAAQFPTTRNAAVGTLLAGSTTVRNMPDYVRVTVTINTVEWNFRIWFSNAAFMSQYDLFELRVVPPVASLALFQGSQAALSTAIFSRSLTDTYGLVNAIIAEDPPTTTQAYNVVWSDPTGGGGTLNTPWTLIEYGNGAADDNNIRDAIKTYLATTAPGVSNWSTIFPGLYGESEFVVVPLWGAIPPQTSGDQGVYSGFANVNSLRGIMQARVPPTYATAASSFIPTNLEVFASQWRGMNFLTLGNPSNMSPKYKFSETLIPDYLDVPTGSADFGRMTLATQQFMETLTEAFEEARDFTPTSIVPSGFTSLQLGGRLFIAFQSAGFRILILTRYSYNLLI